MYGIVEIQGHQYTVKPGDIVDVEKVGASEGETFELKDVLLVAKENEAPLIGMPYVDGAKVQVKLLQHRKDKKVLTIKRKPRKWLKRKGHRQHYSCLLVTELSDGSGNSITIDKNSDVAKKYL